MTKNGQPRKIENLFSTREGQTQLANELAQVLDNIEADRRLRGSVRPGLAKPNQIKRFVIEALFECNRHRIAPPPALIELIQRLLEVGSDENRREGGLRKHPAMFREAARVFAGADRPPSTRELAAELRKLGHDAKHRTIANYVVDPQFPLLVERLRAAHRKT